MSSRWMEVIPVTDVTPDHADWESRLGRGSTHRSVWHSPAPADMTPAFGADGTLSMSVGDGRLLWGRIRLFCALHTVAIFEYQFFCKSDYLTIPTVPMCYHSFQSQRYFQKYSA